MRKVPTSLVQQQSYDKHCELCAYANKFPCTCFKVVIEIFVLIILKYSPLHKNKTKFLTSFYFPFVLNLDLISQLKESLNVVYTMVIAAKYY